MRRVYVWSLVGSPFALWGDKRDVVLVVLVLERRREKCIDKDRKGVTQFNAAGERDAAADLQIAACTIGVSWDFLGESNAYSCLPSRSRDPHAPRSVSQGNPTLHRLASFLHHETLLLSDVCFTRA
jgi:hypothetical protein